MRLAIDLRPLQIGHENRGVGAYLINLLQNLPADASTHFIFLRYDSSNPLTDFNLPIPDHYTDVTYKRRMFSKKPLGALKFLIGQLTPKYLKLIFHRPDVFFQTDYLLGAPRIPGVRVIVVSYDLIPLKFRSMYLPSWQHFWRMRHYSLKARVRLSLRAKYYTNKYAVASRLLKRCDTILSISNTTKNDLVELLNISPNKIKVVYLAPSLRDSDPSDTISSLVKSLNTPYLLFIGGTDRRRKVYELVNAYNKLRARGIQCSLVLAGNEFTIGSTRLDSKTSDAVRLSSYRKDIYLTGSVTEGDKYYLLSKARCFVYPSIYEGFGMPVVEALSLATPVVAFRNAALEELAPDEVHFSESFDSQELAIALEDVITRKVAPQSKPISAGDYSWEKTAEKTWKVLIKVQ